uniref:Dimer_Tnp_hAT domain-containing protein n=1 Tax=Heterorhabditis bacteriophora TaxID=37862 RepID=A0A1I7X3R2_HETBA
MKTFKMYLEKCKCNKFHIKINILNLQAIEILKSVSIVSLPSFLYLITGYILSALSETMFSKCKTLLHSKIVIKYLYKIFFLYLTFLRQPSHLFSFRIFMNYTF